MTRFPAQISLTLKKHIKLRFGFMVLYRGGQFHWWRKPEYTEKTTTLKKLMKTNRENMKHTVVPVHVLG
jgi:hypothetical protein